MRASTGRAAFEPTLAGVRRHAADRLEFSPDSNAVDAFRLGAGQALELVDDAPTVRIGHLDLASNDQVKAADPARRRFATWSRRYVLLVATSDALVGGISAAVPASISNTLSGHNTVPLLCLIGLVVWPAAIAICRGYRRNRIGIGFDEPGAVIRAGMLIVVAVALPVGFMAVPTGALNPTRALTFTLYALLSSSRPGYRSRSC